MLDFSDDEFELESVERRNLSPTLATGARVNFGRKEGGPHVGFADRTQSIFKEFRKKSSKLIMPVSNPPISEAFFVSEVIPDGVLKSKSEFDNFKVSKLWKNSIKFSSLEDHPDSFYKSMQTVVFTAQFFGVFPVTGIRGRNYTDLAFKWIHYRMVYWSLTFFGTVFCFACSAIGGLDDGAFRAASGIFYFACGILSSLLMLNLSRNWKNLNREFAEVEFKFRKYGYPKRIGFKFKIFTIVILVAALGKLLFLLSLVIQPEEWYEFKP